METRIPYLEVGGGPREIGRQVGEATRDIVARGIAGYEERFPALAGLSFAEAVERARAYVRPAEAYVPRAVEQIRGLAEGADQPFERIFALNCSEEFTCAADREWPLAGHCTSFAFVAGGRVVSGHNEDWYPDDAEQLVVRKVAVAGGAGYICVGPPYYLPITGLTKYGFSSAANTVYFRDERVGVPNNCLLSQVLECEGVEAARDLISGAPRARGSNHLLAAGDGRILDVETTAERVAVLEGGDGFVHTNHYVSPELAPEDASRSEGSPLRRARAQELIESGLAEGLDPVALARAVLTDHANAPSSICSHWNDDDPDEDQSVTTVAMVWEPAEGRAHVAAGQPCEHDWVTYGL